MLEPRIMECLTRLQPTEPAYLGSAGPIYSEAGEQPTGTDARPNHPGDV